MNWIPKLETHVLRREGGRGVLQIPALRSVLAFLVLVRCHGQDAPAFINQQQRLFRASVHAHWGRQRGGNCTDMVPRGSVFTVPAGQRHGQVTRGAVAKHTTSCTPSDHPRRALTRRGAESHTADRLGRWLPAEAESGGCESESQFGFNLPRPSGQSQSHRRVNGWLSARGQVAPDLRAQPWS